MEELATSLILAVFTAGIALTFWIGDRETPTSRALTLMFALMAGIFVLSGLRRSGIAPEWPGLWERVGAIAEAAGMIAAIEWVLRVLRTAAPGEADSPDRERVFRAAQGVVALHAAVGLFLTQTRLAYAHGDWGMDVLGEPRFWIFIGPIVAGASLAAIGITRVLRSEIDEAERLRLRGLGLATPFLVSGIPMTPPWEYVTTAIGEIIFLSASVRYLVLQGRRGQFLERFLSPQVVRLVRERGLATAMQQDRVQLSVVACDLRGFTAFAETAAPEEVLQFLREYYEAIGAAVRESGGTIKDFAGDGVLTLVGAPIPYADHAGRAVELARGIHARAGEILARWRRIGLDLGIGIGVASGYVTVGTISSAERLEYAAIGPAVNLAARLCDRAESGQILVDQRTVGLAGEGKLRFEALEPVELKGFARPVPVSTLAA